MVVSVGDMNDLSTKTSGGYYNETKNTRQTRTA
jgi:hypothetical protein